MKLSYKRPEKRLRSILPKHSGRDNSGQVAVRHQGGRHKRLYRIIDWKRDKFGITAKVLAFEYDPNRSANIALLQYADGEKRYILATKDIKIGDKVVSDKKAEVQTGNAMQIKNIPVGTPIHNIELTPGKGGQIVRSAGSFATVLSKEGNYAQIKLSSGEIRLIRSNGFATIGQVGNIKHKTQQIGSAGRARHMGRRPTVRGVAQNPRTHPHGGGEGRSGIGMKSPKSKWGKRTLGKRTRSRKKLSSKYIIKRRKK